MILPQTYSMVLILMALGLLCWGSWANTYKLAGKFRFEIYYMDFAFGCLALALIYAFTLGNWGFDGFSFLDDLEHAGKKQWLFGFIAGAVFNLGNMLLTSAMAVGGMAISFLSGIGMAIILGSLLGLLIQPTGSPAMILLGCALLAASIVVVAVAANILGIIRYEALAKAGMTKSTRRPTSLKGVILAVAGGLFLGSYQPLLNKATEGDAGMGPYSALVMFSIGLFFSTLVYEVFFTNLPVEGEPIEVTAYFRARLRQHSWGLLGGALWGTGAVALLAAGYTPVQSAHLSPAANGMLTQAYPLLAALWGLLVWHEFREGDLRVRLSALVTLVLFVGGLMLLSAAPLYSHKG